MSTMRDRALTYLSSGLNETQTASALGVSIPLISAFMADSNFSETVQARRTVALQQNTELQTNYAAAQLKLSAKLLELINEDYPWTPIEAVKVSETLDKLSERYRPKAAIDTATNINILQITLPANAVAQYTTNSRNEIIAVDGELLETVNAQQLIASIMQSPQPENQHDISRIPSKAPSRFTSKAQQTPEDF